MKVLIDNGIKTRIGDYPNENINVAVGGEYTYYFINQSDRPIIDHDKSFLKATELLTDEKNETYPHLFNAYLGFEVIDYPQFQIIQKLNDNLGIFLDSEYPIWKRLDDEDTLLNSDDEDKKAYILSKKQWRKDCKVDRDLRENNFINNGVFPDLHTFEPMPLNL